MVKVKVSKQNIDEDLYIKSEKLKINNKSIKTPIKSIDVTKTRIDTEISPLVRGVNEIFKTFKIDTIKECVNGRKDTKDIYKEIDIHYKRNSNQNNGINFCFTTVKDSFSLNEKEINILTNIGYNRSDATPLPIFENLFKNKNYDIKKSLITFFELMEQCIESINRLNNKPIIGIIPSSIPDSFISTVVEFYHDNNITSYAFDFEGNVHSGSSGKIRELMISTIKLDILNESFIYSLNTQRGKVTRGTNITKGNDILVYNFGFDIMGDNHIPPKFPPDVAESLKKRSKAMDGKPLVRLFNSNDYGHHKHDNLSDAYTTYPHKETKIPFNNFQERNKAKITMTEKLFNSERIGIELLKYQKLINENEMAIKYLKTKNQIANDLASLCDFRNEIKI